MLDNKPIRKAARRVPRTTASEADTSSFTENVDMHPHYSDPLQAERLMRFENYLLIMFSHFINNNDDNDYFSTSKQLIFTSPFYEVLNIGSFQHFEDHVATDTFFPFRNTSQRRINEITR